jgi:nicotinate-nucleotide--dimethylbenzimidazole phosphoribosyltransferase
MKLEEIVSGIKPVDEEWIHKARERTAKLLMPTRALGRLHGISEQLCGIQQVLKPTIRQKAVLVMAGDHGVVEEDVSAYPQEITAAMVQTFLAGGAGINVISRLVGAEVWVVDMGVVPDLDQASLAGKDRLLVRKVAKGTDNFTRGPAMSREQAEETILTGFRVASELFIKGTEILGTGDMGIGNTTPSTAVGTVITGKPLDELVGRGAGVDDEGLRRKKDAIQRGLDINAPDPKDALDVLGKVGGFEIGGIAGVLLSGAYHGYPVVIDGFISTAGALIAHTLSPHVTDYLLAGHCSKEPGHRVMLDHLKMRPILDLGMRLGEGTGAALSMIVIETAVRVFNDMFTFEDVGLEKHPDR